MTQLARARQAATMTDWLDIGLAYDPTTRRADIALGADGDLVLDETPATPMLITLGSDRRARPDDELPTGLSDLNRPSSLVERRGWAGDALDDRGELIGNRLWLLDRAKASDLTLLMAEEWLKEGYAWAETETGTAAAIDVAWVRAGMLGIAVFIDGETLQLARKVS